MRYKDLFRVFEKFIKYIISKGYESKYMYDIYNDQRTNVLQGIGMHSIHVYFLTRDKYKLKENSNLF
jgi:hypothetical protein